VDGADHKLPSDFKFYSMNKLNEKEYIEEPNTKLADIAMQLKIYKKKK